MICHSFRVSLACHFYSLSVAAVSAFYILGNTVLIRCQTKMATLALPGNVWNLVGEGGVINNTSVFAPKHNVQSQILTSPFFSLFYLEPSPRPCSKPNSPLWTSSGCWLFICPLTWLIWLSELKKRRGWNHCIQYLWWVKWTLICETEHFRPFPFGFKVYLEFMKLCLCEKALNH